MNNRVVKKESAAAAAAAASSQKKNSESNCSAKDDDGVSNNHHEVTINNNSFNDAVVDVDDDGDELLRTVMAEAMATMNKFYSTTTSVLLPNTNTNTNTYVNVNDNDTAAAAPTTVALPVVNNSDTLSTTSTTTTVADVMAKSYNDSNNNTNSGDDAVTIAGHDDTTATKADDVGNDEGKSNNDNNNNNNNDRINEGVQKIKTEPRESVWVLYNGNNNNINSNSNSNSNSNNDDDDYHKRQHKGQTATQSRSAMKKKDKENSKDDSPTTNRKRTRDHSDDEESLDDSNIDDEIDDEEDPRKDNNDVRNPQKNIRRSRKNDEIWMGMFEKLAAYKNQHTNTMVPGKYDQDPKLGLWVSNQRQSYKNDDLYPDRVDLLKSLEFKWVGVCGGVAGGWMSMFQKLVEYKKQHTNTAVTNRYDEDPKLGRWVSNQRQAYRNDKLNPNRVDLLNTIAFDWDGLKGKVVTDQMIWMNMFQKLVAYKNQHKTTFVPVKNDPKLGEWVKKQRKEYKNDKLLPKRLALLNSIDFTWNGNMRYMCLDN